MLEKRASTSRAEFVRSSRFRHIYAEATKHKFTELRISSKATESVGIRANANFLAFAWEGGGGGSLAVLPHSKHGRVPHSLPLIFAHNGGVLDFEFDPFNPQRLLSCSEDGTVKSWLIPPGGMVEHLKEPEAVLKTHAKKVSFCTFNSTAGGIVASASFDSTIKVHDLEGQETVFDIATPDITYALQWSPTGKLFATTSKDKLVRCFDPRAQTTATEARGHQGSKASKCCWGKDDTVLITTGFSSGSSAERQLFLWDLRNTNEPKTSMVLDQGTGSLFPFLDSDTGVMFLWGKGDGNIRYYELTGSDLHYIDEHRTSVPQKGVTFLPKQTVDVGKHEFLKGLKLETNAVQPVGFIVPRKSDQFQEDLYPDCLSGEPGVAAEQWLKGEDGVPPRVPIGVSQAKSANPVARAPTLSVRQLLDAAETANKEKDELIAQQAARIRQLELRVAELEARTSPAGGGLPDPVAGVMPTPTVSAAYPVH
jgi:coronin-1B/1C/6